MKTIKLRIKAGLAAVTMLLLVACEQEERVQIRKEAIAEIAENVGKAEQERFLTQQLEIEIKHVEACRKSVEVASTPNDLALATEDLRQANDQMNRTMKQIDDLD